MSELVKPKSINHQWINFLGVLSLAMSFLWCVKFSIQLTHLIFICMATYSGTIILLEQFFAKEVQAKSPLLQKLKAFNLERYIKKMLGLYFTYGMLFLCYLFIPEYHHDAYIAYWPFIKSILIVSSILAIPYFALMDALVGERDAYWIIGSWLCFDLKQIKPNRGENLKLIKQHCLVWIVKGYFIPVCFINLEFFLSTLLNIHAMNIFADVQMMFLWCVTLLFSLDFFVALLGYLLTLRLFNIEVRSVESTWFGWIICIICYEPFTRYLLHIPSLQDQSMWLLWIKSQSLLWVWCSLLIFLLAMYVWGTVSFGVRFSNLTHRGIITNGPFRFTKHPNYVFKNLFWWLACFPFAIFMGDWLHTMYVVLIMIVLNLVYYYRAKTEENHLSKDPTYVQYALWMNEHGLFAPLARRFKFLIYKPL